MIIYHFEGGGGEGSGFSGIILFQSGVTCRQWNIEEGGDKKIYFQLIANGVGS